MAKGLSTVTSSDDWNAHWTRFGAAARRSPANTYRYELILSTLSGLPPNSRILDIGSGQGELALLLAISFPGAEIRGLEYSEAGVERSRSAAASAGVRAAFTQRDLLSEDPVDPGEAGWATVAVCSEVLEHVDDPALFLRHAIAYLAPGCRLVVTVPGGPRTAFDRHIGHRRHFNAKSLRVLLESCGLQVHTIKRAGFPFFNLYKLMMLARGSALQDDLQQTDPTLAARFGDLIMPAFQRAFRWSLPSSPLGWQLLAEAELPAL